MSGLAGVTVELVRRLQQAAGTDAVITGHAARRTYESDGLTTHRAIPGVVVLPKTAAALRAVVQVCADTRTPWVARGSGTGLSAGALPLSDGVLIVTSRLRRLIEVDTDNRRAVLEPGVTNLAVTHAAAPFGLYYAPDPSSQQVCSIGGNVAENSGGAHCLKYGFTAHHVTGLDIVLPDGQAVTLGGKAPEHPGYDLVGAFVGSEGTLGVATRVTVRLLPKPEAVVCLLAGFATIDDAAEAVSAIVAAGVAPAAVEMMDALAIEAAEQTVHCQYPDGAGAVLIVEVDGPAPEVEADVPVIERILTETGAFEIRVAADAAERATIWKGRKSAFAAMGRISPDYYVQDSVVPRTELPAVLAKIGEMAAAAGLRVANVFHAGDGNLHPLVLYDADIAGQAEQAAGVAGAIVELCVAHGGSITGEHGVGLDKKAHMADMFNPADLDTMQRLRCAFDPEGLANPGKMFPTPRLCGEAPGPRRGAHPLVERGVAELY